MSIPIHTMLQSIKEGDCCHFMVKFIFTQLYIKEYWWWINFYSQIITVPQRGWLLSLSGFTHLQTAVHQRVSVRTEPLIIFSHLSDKHFDNELTTHGLLVNREMVGGIKVEIYVNTVPTHLEACFAWLISILGNSGSKNLSNYNRIFMPGIFVDKVTFNHQF